MTQTGAWIVWGVILFIMVVSLAYIVDSPQAYREEECKAHEAFVKKFLRVWYIVVGIWLAPVAVRAYLMVLAS